MNKFYFTPFWFSIMLETMFEWLELKIAQHSYNVDMRKENAARRKLLRNNSLSSDIKVKEQFVETEANVLVRKIS